MTGNVRIVTRHTEWEGCLDRVSGIQASDIYFSHDYADLYAVRDVHAEAFFYSLGRDFFFLPYLVRPLPEELVWSHPLLDIETPYGYGGPLSTSLDPRFLSQAWARFYDFCRSRGIVAGFLRFHPLLQNHRLALRKFVRVLFERETVYLSKDGKSGGFWDAYKSVTRNRIRKSEKAGITVSVATGRHALRLFFRFYAERMQELCAHVDYMFSQEYFDKIADMGERRHKVYVARRNGEAVGGYLALSRGEYFHYHLGASPRRYQKCCVNNALMHAMIDDFSRGRWKVLHLGGGVSAQPDDALLRFKAGFSPLRARFYIGAVIPDAAVYEAVCERWRKLYPCKVPRFGKRVLMYRY